MQGSSKAHRVRRCYGNGQLGRTKPRRKKNKLLFRKKEREDENSFNLEDLRDKWRALVSAVMKLRVP